MADTDVKEFLVSLPAEYLIATIEAARLALTASDVASDIGLEWNISDADLNNLQHKLHEFIVMEMKKKDAYLQDRG